MAKQSQLGTANSVLGSTMSLGVAASAGATVHNETINQTLTLSQIGHGWIEDKTFSQNIGLTQNVSELLLTAEKSVNTSLSLTQNASATREIPIGVSHVLVLASLGGRTLSHTINQALGVSDTLNHFNYVEDRKPAGNSLNLSQTVLVSSNPNAENTLNLVQTVNVQGPTKVYVSQHLGLSSKTSTPHRAFIEQAISMSQAVGVAYPIHITQNLNLTHDSPIGGVSNTLNLTQNVTAAFSITASNTINLSAEVDLEGIWVRSIAHSDIVGHSLTWLEDTPCKRKQYTPFQGENTISSGFSPPSNVLQDPQGDIDTFSLYVPYLGTPTNQVTMRKPELDNRDRNSYTRVNNETRGGKLIVFADPDWPKVRTLAVTIVGLTEAKVDELQTFMEDTLGQEIGLTDWEGRLWKGFITNPNEPAVQDGRTRWTVTFEFEGEILEVEQPGGEDGSQLNITQSVSAVIV